MTISAPLRRAGFLTFWLLRKHEKIISLHRTVEPRTRPSRILVVSDSRRWLGRGRVLQMRKAWPGHPTFPSRLNVRTFGRSSVGQAPLAMLLEQSINELNKNPHRRPRSLRTRGLAGDRMETRIDSRCAFVSFCITPTSPASPAPCVLLRRIFRNSSVPLVRSLALQLGLRKALDFAFVLRLRVSSPLNRRRLYASKHLHALLSNRWYFELERRSGRLRSKLV